MNETVIKVNTNRFPQYPLLSKRPKPTPGFVVVQHYATFYRREREVLRTDWVEDDGGYLGGPRLVPVPVYGEDYYLRYLTQEVRWQVIPQEEYDNLPE
jgi:hypothetical protein